MREPLLVAILGFGMLAGIFSPMRDQAFVLLVPFAPAFFIGSPAFLLYLAMLLVSALTIMLAGLPAALFERLTGRRESDNVSLGIWAAGTAILSAPALLFGQG